MTNIMNTNVLLLTRRITSQSITIHAWSTYLYLTLKHMFSNAGGQSTLLRVILPLSSLHSGAAQERRDWASPCPPPWISKPAILRAAADTRVREREMSFLLFFHIKLLLSPVVRGGGADTCTGAGGGTRKTITYQILHLIHVQHDICGCCAGMGFIVRH